MEFSSSGCHKPHEFLYINQLHSCGIIHTSMGSSVIAQCFLLCVFVFASVSWALDPKTEFLQNADRVVQIPGQPPVEFKHYSGYVPATEGKHLFYWFFEAVNKPADSPLLLWLNGGPGCSSVGFGEAQELGPFLVKKDHEIVYNNYTWNNVTNLLFLESPADVGFSYSTLNTTAVTYGDNATAFASHAFLLNWLERFPQYKSNEFYIAGESYAGHYVPQLANLIFDENKKASNHSYINLKGFMIGNALMDLETDQIGMVDYAWSHALISDGLHAKITKNCNFAVYNQTQDCIDAVNTYYKLYDIMDMYSLYSPTCPAGLPFTAAAKSSMTTQNTNDKPLSMKSLLRIPAGYDPCMMFHATTYFNRPDVQEALHANVTKISRPWALCNNAIFNVYKDVAFSVLPIIKKLVDGGVRAWVYSGDTDGRVPVTATRYTLNKLGLNVTEDWTAWYNYREIGGWSIVYDGLTFVTVRGAGHQVPTYAPMRSLQLVKNFLANQKMPTVSF